LGRNAAGSRGEVTFIDQADTQAAQARVESNAGASDAAAENEEVERLVLEGVEVPFHGWSFSRSIRRRPHANQNGARMNADSAELAIDESLHPLLGWNCLG